MRPLIYFHSRGVKLLTPVLALIAALTAQNSPDVLSKHVGDTFTLSNEAIVATWSVGRGGLLFQRLTNRFTGVALPLSASVFELVPKEGAVLRSADFKIIGQPVVEDIVNPTDSSRAADHLPGKQIRAELEDSSGNVHVTWRAVLRERANYVVQDVTIHAAQQPLAFAQIILVDALIPGATVSGHAKASPVTAGTWFAGFEHPLSECRVRGERTSCWLARELPINSRQSVTYSSVFGVSHRGQLRRDFLSYLELERAHPYRTFLHYNTWYDLGYFDRYTEQQVIDSIRGFGEQLAKQRGVKLDSFLLDDGWDDPANLWKFNSNFPDGLTNVAQAAGSVGGAPGIWFSPWGGYDKPKEQRLASARVQGFETNDGGFALSGPKYYRYFRDACLAMIDRYGVNQFKFDGTGNADRVIEGSEFDSDFDAAIHLIGELRAKKPDVYINLTTGTYPSPFWLLYADSIWRGGEDHSFA